MAQEFVISFLMGILACGMVCEAGALLHESVERRMRIRAARRRVSRLA